MALTESRGIALEGRRMNRQEILLRHIDRGGAGLEIGACFHPVAPRREGFNVEILDILNQEELIERYQKRGASVENVQKVDYLWRGEPYAELTGKRRHYDWIIASHVIEHTPDLIGFLNECDSILKEDGVLSLAIPDVRYCFDHFRPISGIGSVIDRHLQKIAVTTPGTLVESRLNGVKKSRKIAWDRETGGIYRLRNSLEDARDALKLDADERRKLDPHVWCFVPHSFRLIMQDLFDLGLTQFREVEFTPTRGHEFYVTLGRKGTPPDFRRLELMKIIQAEIGEGLDPSGYSRKEGWKEAGQKTAVSPSKAPRERRERGPFSRWRRRVRKSLSEWLGFSRNRDR